MGARRWWILFALIVALLPLALDLGLVVVALPDLARELPASRTRSAEVAAAFPLALAVLFPVVSLAAHRWRLRPLLLAGLAVCLAGSVGEATADTLGPVLVARIVVALGAAAALPAALRVLRTVFEPAEHVRAIAIWAGFTGLGVAAAPLLGGRLVDSSGWRSVFVAEVALLAVGLLGVGSLLPALEASAPESARGRVELSGPAAVFLLTGTAAALSFRLQLDSHYSATRTGAVLALPVAAFSVAVRVVAPLLFRAPQAFAPTGLALGGVSLLGLAEIDSGIALALLVPLGAGAAMALGAAPAGDPVLRTLAAGLGIAVLGALDQGLLVGAVVAGVASGLSVGTHLLGRAGSRRRSLTPP